MKIFNQNKKLRVFFYIIFLCHIFVSGLQAQVTIGAGLEPNDGSLLQLKESDGDENSHKGLNLPRVSLIKKNMLLPMFLKNPESHTPDYSDAFIEDSVNLKLAHKGLLVYNLTEDEDEELMVGINQWDGEQWNCLQSKMGNAKFDPVRCSDIAVSGTYIEGKDVNASHYLAITVNIIKEGAYSIVAKSERNSPGNPGHGGSNGYSYYLTGVALNKGPATLIVPCQGRPVYVSEEISPGVYNKDNLIVEGLPMESSDPTCPSKVQVATDVATYTINCDGTVVHGQYLKGRPLSISAPGNNTITVHVNVSNPGSYKITTPKTNGISFSASGGWTAPGVYQVTLLPDPANTSNAPIVNEDFPIEINTNTPTGNSKCTAIIPITLPPMTYALIGEDGTYSWANMRRPALQNGTSFGPNGTVRVMEFKEMWSTNDAVIAQGHINNGFTGTTNGVSYNSAKPDVILYFAYAAPNSLDLTTALNNYVNSGGVLIYAANSIGWFSGGTTGQGVDDVNMMMNGMFGSAYRTAQWQTNCLGLGGITCPVNANYDSAYKINEISGDPIVNGPFGNLGGKYWAEDNDTAGTTILTTLPPNSIQVCPAYNDYSHMDVNPDYSTVWYNESKNFFFFGDTNGANNDKNDKVSYPACYTVSGVPVSKQYGNSDDSRSPFTHVAHLELNAVAWAIKKAAVSGINPH